MGTSNITSDASAAYAECFSSARFSDLNDAAIDVAKKSIIDTVGVSLAATTLNPDAARLAAIVGGFGAQGGCRILGFGGRAAAPLAAWVNGGMAHALDFDDIAYDAFAHPSAAVVPAMFAVAELVGDVHGEDFITALALAQDMVVRMSESVDWKVVAPLPWLPFPLAGTFAAAGACSRLLRLDVSRTQAAISGALAYAAGAGELQHGGLRGLYDSWAAQGGVLAALVAREGVAAPAQPLEGTRGFFSQYWQGAYDRARLLDGLGRKVRNVRTGYKAWPSCAVTHPAVDAAIRIATHHAIDVDAIDHVEVRVSAAAWPQCHPLDEKRKPSTVMDAKFSIPFTVAIALSTGNVTLDDFSPQRLRDAGVLSLAQRVTPLQDPTLQGRRGVDPCVVSVAMKSGEVHSTRTDAVYGHEDNPMSMAAIESKFADCARYAVVPPGAAAVEAFVSDVKRLEELDDAGQLLGLLEPRVARNPARRSMETAEMRETS